MKSSNRSREIRIIPIPLDGEIVAGDSVAGKLLEAMRNHKVSFTTGDILIVKHKIVSKAEGQMVKLDGVKSSASSRRWAQKYNLDARVTEVAISQSKRIVRRKRGVLITETQHGLVCANSGVDVSNVDGGQSALLLPRDPDGSARLIHRELKKRIGIFIPVIITDSFGRPWREGLTEVAIGVAGMKPMHDYRRQRDSHRYVLRASIEAVADELACAAGLACGKLSRTPACIIRGYNYQRGRGNARELIRPAANDLFR
jgi:coenzyme F420-0:L-glutamate ligase/coenzyme F420-1:gamma-L-glutamate ligase